MTMTHFEWNTLDLKGSDHKAILSSFFFPSCKLLNEKQSQHHYIKPEIVTIPKYKFYAPIDIHRYKITTIDKLQSLKDKYQQQSENNLFCTKQLDDISYEYFNIMKNIAAKFIGISKKINKRQPWATIQSTQICNKTAKMYKLWKNTKIRHYHAYKSLRKQRNKICLMLNVNHIKKLSAKLNSYKSKGGGKTVKEIRGFQYNYNDKYHS